MNKTPRTEAVVKMAVGPMREYAIIEHAQTLERELLKAREESDKAREAEQNWRITASSLRTECEELREELEILRSNKMSDPLLATTFKHLKAERDEAREEADHWKTEYEIVLARLCGRKHPRDNGIVAPDEIIPMLTRERDEAREALIPFISLNPNSKRVQERWDDFVQAAKKALEAAK